MQKRVALYVRVSTYDQTTENQLQELEAIAGRHSWKIVAVFNDEGISGAAGRDKRPGYDALMKGVARKEFDMVAAWSVDRLGRSLQNLVSFLTELRAKDVDLFLHKQGLDTSTPAGRAMYQMLGVFAEFELAMNKERIRAGLARAKAAGKRVGRPRVSQETEERIRREGQKGSGMRKIAKNLGVGVSVVQRVLRGRDRPQPPVRAR